MTLALATPANTATVCERLGPFVANLAGRLDAARVAPCDELAPDAAQVVLSVAALRTLLAGVDLAAAVPEVAAFATPRQLGFVAGRLCAELAQARLGIAPRPLARGSGGEPVWPASACGSIAHGKALAVAVVARRSPRRAAIGIDVEAVVDAASLEDVIDACMTRDEALAIRRAHRPAIDATLRFSAKEAYYKAVYPTLRRWIDFDAVEIVQVDVALRRFVVQPVAAWSGVLPRLPGRFAFVGEDLMTCVDHPPAD